MPERVGEAGKRTNTGTSIAGVPHGDRMGPRTNALQRHDQPLAVSTPDAPEPIDGRRWEFVGTDRTFHLDLRRRIVLRTPHIRPRPLKGRRAGLPHLFVQLLRGISPRDHGQTVGPGHVSKEPARLPDVNRQRPSAKIQSCFLVVVDLDGGTRVLLDMHETFNAERPS